MLHLPEPSASYTPQVLSLPSLTSQLGIDVSLESDLSPYSVGREINVSRRRVRACQERVSWLAVMSPSVNTARRLTFLLVSLSLTRALTLSPVEVSCFSTRKLDPLESVKCLDLCLCNDNQYAPEECWQRGWIRQ